MFKHAAKRQVDWPVEVSVAQSGGTVQSVEVTLRYELATRSEIKGMSDAGYGVLDEEADERTLDQLCEKIKGWGDEIVDENDNPIPFSQENLRAVLENPAFARAAVIGLIQASTGAAAKN